VHVDVLVIVHVDEYEDVHVGRAFGSTVLVRTCA